ncbi:MAG: hypothetical protein C5B54_00140 [Acidobacteria bacterium]|nr:MAG: hypothetical protein C5B54_00140 [Acidobacteriota bacterium]
MTIRRKAAILLLLLLIAIFVALHTVRTPERWAVKTGSDQSAANVNVTPKITTLAEMNNWVPPSKDLNATRVGVELQVWKVNAVLKKFTLALDQDIHMQLIDDQGNTIVAELPDPSRVSNKSRFKPQITEARSAFLKHYSISHRWRVVNTPVSVTGIGFWDFYGLPVFDFFRRKFESSSGVARNQIELHPILQIEFLR